MDPGAGFRASSPANAGRASPALRVSRQLAEQGVNSKDKSYRRYASGIERTVAAFETTEREWADYISFLARLLKALQAHPEGVRVVPESQAVSRHLAQCLSPTLPSGVHQKALEVYNYVLELIGKTNLERDLYLYLPGLVAVLSFASLSVRPIFAQVLEKHLLSLDPSALRSPLKAIILAILPGIEDEGSEDFERWIEILNKFRKASRSTSQASDISDAQESSSDSYFWQCFFLATITNPSRRGGALAYLARELPKFGQTTGPKAEKHELSVEAKATVLPEPGLLIRCLASGLADDQILVQRGFLDLLVTHLPLNSPVLQQMVPVADLDRLIYASIGVVARRDMSLNRRLWSWLLGPESSEELDANTGLATVKSPSQSAPTQANHFARYGLQSLIRSLKTMFKNNMTSSERSKPFRLCLSLMDRWEVGGLIIPDIFTPAIRNAYEISRNSKKNDADDVVKSASNFFDGIESGLIWTKFNQLIAGALSDPNSSGDLDLCLFIASRFNIREEEMVTRHIPLSSLFLLSHLSKIDVSDESRITALDILERLIVLIPARSFVGEKARQPPSPPQRSEVLKSISTFYAEHHGGLDGTTSPYSPFLLGQIIFLESLGLLLDLFAKSPASPAIDSLTRVVCNLMQKVPDAQQMISQLAVFDSLTDLLEIGSEQIISFRVIAATTAFLVSYHSISSIRTLSVSLQTLVIRHLWAHLRPYIPKHHVEAVRCLWQIEDISPHKKVVEAAITTFIASELEDSTSADAARQFAIFWMHSTREERQLPADKGTKGSMRRVGSAIGGLGQSVIPPDPSNVLSRPLLFLLDYLTEEGTEVAAFMRAWAGENASLGRVFHILISRLQALSCMSLASTHNIKENGTQAKLLRLGSYDDSRECLYFMKHLLNMFRFASDHTWIVVSGESTGEYTDSTNPSTIQTTLVSLSLTALDIQGSGDERCHITDLHRVSLETILAMLRNPYAGSLKSLDLEDVLLKRLHSRLSTIHHLLQPPLLESIIAALRLKVTSIAATPPMPMSPGFRKTTRENLSLPLKGAHSLAPPSKESLASAPEKNLPPKLLIESIKLGFQTKSSRLVIDSWVAFLVDVLPIYPESIFENLIPLVECLCSQIALAFGQLRSIYQLSAESGHHHKQPPPEGFLLGLLNALENLLATAHEQLISDETRSSQLPKSPEHPAASTTNFFGAMASGLFSGDSGTPQPGRQSTANSRLTVLLCFQDAVRACFAIWSWGIYENAASASRTAPLLHSANGARVNEKLDSSSLASYSHTSLRVRHRARRLLEHLFAAETLECMETLATLWCRPDSNEFRPSSVLAVLNVLSGSRPRHTMPAIFNSIYTRTNPGALEPFRQSSLSSELSEADLSSFLLAYIRSVDDDAMDEIWGDCVAFIRDVLSNPLPHSQILPSLVVFLAILAEKSEGTNFGEQRRMRRELGDLFLRLLTAMFTTKPAVLLDIISSDAAVTSGMKKGSKGFQSGASGLDVFSALIQVLPQLKIILPEPDRLQNAVNSITANVTGPCIRARSFPANIDSRLTNVLAEMVKISTAGKFWKKDVSDAFTDSKFFHLSISNPAVRSGWLKVLGEYVSNGADPDRRLEDLIQRLNAPTTAGIVFGVGATAARAQEDARTGGCLRRIAVLLLACPVDSFARYANPLILKLNDLVSATTTSSPSSGTRPDIYLVARALVMRVSGQHLSTLWGVLNADLMSSMISVLPKEEGDSSPNEVYNNLAVVGACKLLDELVCLQGDEWQLHEWLFITDTIDAVYAPPREVASRPVAVVDAIAEGLGNISIKEDESEDENDSEKDKPQPQRIQQRSRALSVASTKGSPAIRLPILPSVLASAGLDAGDFRAISKPDLAVRVLRPFFGQLSLVSFEATYGMLRADEDECVNGLLNDLFDSGDNIS